MLHTGNEVHLKKRNPVNIDLKAQGYTESVRPNLLVFTDMPEASLFTTGKIFQ